VAKAKAGEREVQEFTTKVVSGMHVHLRPCYLSHDSQPCLYIGLDDSQPCLYIGLDLVFLLFRVAMGS
jgi:hypothetical protein